jgi:hypothetical protein
VKSKHYGPMPAHWSFGTGLVTNGFDRPQAGLCRNGKRDRTSVTVVGNLTEACICKALSVFFYSVLRAPMKKISLARSALLFRRGDGSGDRRGRQWQPAVGSRRWGVAAASSILISPLRLRQANSHGNFAAISRRCSMVRAATRGVTRLPTRANIFEFGLYSLEPIGIQR